MKKQFGDLVAAWADLRHASREMLAGPVPSWPWDRTSPAFLENRRLRDRTQGVGMRFASIWNAHADEVRAIVDARPDLFPRYHVADRKGGRVDPTPYMESMTVMPVIVSLTSDQDD